jgi:hypothetical protein
VLGVGREVHDIDDQQAMIKQPEYEDVAHAWCDCRSDEQSARAGSARGAGDGSGYSNEENKRGEDQGVVCPDRRVEAVRASGVAPERRIDQIRPVERKPGEDRKHRGAEAVGASYRMPFRPGHHGAGVLLRHAMSLR